MQKARKWPTLSLREFCHNLEKNRAPFEMLHRINLKWNGKLFLGRCHRLLLCVCVWGCVTGEMTLWKASSCSEKRGGDRHWQGINCLLLLLGKNEKKGSKKWVSLLHSTTQAPSFAPPKFILWSIFDKAALNRRSGGRVNECCRRRSCWRRSNVFGFGINSGGNNLNLIHPLQLQEAEQPFWPETIFITTTAAAAQEASAAFGMPRATEIGSNSERFGGRSDRRRSRVSA